MVEKDKFVLDNLFNQKQINNTDDIMQASLSWLFEVVSTYYEAITFLVFLVIPLLYLCIKNIRTNAFAHDTSQPLSTWLDDIKKSKVIKNNIPYQVVISGYDTSPFFKRGDDNTLTHEYKDQFCNFIKAFPSGTQFVWLLHKIGNSQNEGSHVQKDEMDALAEQLQDELDSLYSKEAFAKQNEPSKQYQLDINVMNFSLELTKEYESITKTNHCSLMRRLGTKRRNLSFWIEENHPVGSQEAGRAAFIEHGNYYTLIEPLIVRIERLLNTSMKAYSTELTYGDGINKKEAA